MIACWPGLSAEVVQLACSALLTTVSATLEHPPMLLPSDKNVTVPVGRCAAPLGPLTVVVKVTASPLLDSLPAALLVTVDAVGLAAPTV